MTTAAGATPIKELTSVFDPFAAEIIRHDIIVHAGESGDLELTVVGFRPEFVCSLWKPWIVRNLGVPSGRLDYWLVTCVHENSLVVITANLAVMRHEGAEKVMDVIHVSPL